MRDEPSAAPQVLDLERRRAAREFARHWRQVRRIRLEAYHRDLGGTTAPAMLLPLPGGARLIVDRTFSDEELDVAADWAALELHDRACAVHERADLDASVGRWRSPAPECPGLPELAAWARGDGTPLIERTVAAAKRESSA
jgi:hypothetical protein